MGSPVPSEEGACEQVSGKGFTPQGSTVWVGTHASTDQSQHQAGLEAEPIPSRKSGVGATQGIHPRYLNLNYQIHWQQPYEAEPVQVLQMRKARLGER